MAEQRFTAVLEQVGSRAFLILPFEPLLAWGELDAYYVDGQFNERSFRGVAEQLDDGRWGLALGPTWRRDNGVEVGATCVLVLKLEGHRAENLEPDIAAALTADPEAQRFFESLAPFYRKNFIRWIRDAKRPATREARIAEMMSLLHDRRRER